MRVFAIADLHLSNGVPNKKMDVFGEKWRDHDKKIEQNWQEMIRDDDLVLIAGDISWALHLDDALKDLEWIDRLPGTKVISKGNHDHWWKSQSKVLKVLPPSINLIHNNTFKWNDISICGTRMWDTPDVRYSGHFEVRETPGVNVHVKPNTEEELRHDAKIFKSEIGRLQRSIDEMDPAAKHKICMLHYPPSGPDHKETEVTRILDKADIDICLFGHLHNLYPEAPVNFNINGIEYHCTACDFLNFKPLLLNLNPATLT